jgi:hypothetical protein
MSSSAQTPPVHPPTTNATSPVRQLSVFLHNQVGALLGLVRIMNEHSIEVLGLSLQDSADLTLVRMVVSDPDRAFGVLTEQGISCAIKNIVVVELLEGSHDLARALAALLSAEINIHHTYPLLVRADQRALLALYLDDSETGSEALSRGGFKVVTQGDLSR